MNKSFIGKKLLSLMLSVLMCLSLIPTVAFATIAEGETATVAKIGVTEYTDLPSAIKAAGADDTVVLTDNITLSSYQSISKKVTLDLNGKTLSSTASKTIKLTSPASDLIVKDSNGQGEICNEFAKSEAYTVSIENANAKFTLESGTIESSPNITTIYSEAIDAKGIVNINGGKVIVPEASTDGRGIVARAGSSVNINNCEIMGGSYAVDLFTGAKAYINGNSFISRNDNYSIHIRGSAAVTVGSLDAETIPVINGIKFESNGTDIPNITLVKGKITKVLCMDPKFKYDSFIFTIPDGALLEFGDDSVKPFLPKNVTLTDNGNGTYSIGASKTYVAKTGDTEYETLAEAIAAAKDGDTVTLLADCSGDGIMVDTNKYPTGITIDFANYSYTVGGKLVGSTGTASNGFQLLAGNTITMKNGCIYGDASVAGDDKTDWSGAPAIMIQNYSNLTLDNMTVSGGKQTVFTISNNNGNTVIKDSIIKAGNADGISMYPFAFDVCRYSSYPSVSVTVEGNSVINGNIEISGGIGEGQSRQLNIKNGTFNGKFSVESNVPANIAISGGTFTYEVNPDYCVDGFIPTKNADGTYGVKSGKYVAEVNSVKYETLQAAIDAAGKSQTVTLVSDTKENVTIAKPLTLDLNGYTLNGGTVKGKPALTVTARVTVKDSSTARTGTIMREDTDENSGVSSHYVIDVQGAGWLTFEGGNVKNNSGSSEGKGASLVRIGDDSVAKYPGLNIKGGTFTQNNFVVIKVDRGDLFLNGGTINSANSYAIENWFRATVKGGTVNGDAASWTYSGGANSTLEITGGTINGNVTSVNYGNAEDKKATVKITGGTVNGELDTRSYDPTTGELTAIDDAKKAAIEVTGGTFTNNPTAYLVESSSITKENGKYSVAKAYLAKVGNTQYYTMDEAFKAQTASGEEIVLLRDYKTAGTFSSGSIKRTVDLNGHTWTYTSTGINDAAFEINYSDATLTVKNGKVISNTLVGLIPSALGGTITYDNSTLIFENVEMISNGNSGIETNGNNTNDTVTLKNSTLNVPNGFGIYFPSSGALNIENSKITAKTMGVQVCAGSLNISGDSVINVTGDPVAKTENDGAIQDGAAVSVVNRPGYKGLANVTITGGTFTSENGKAIKAYTWKDMTESDFGLNVIAVSGGTFSSAVPADYCAAGYAPKANTDGTYGVEPKVTTEKRNLSVDINGAGKVEYSINGSDSGIWSNSITKVPYEIGTQFTVKAVPRAGSTFLYWVNSEGRVISDAPTYSFYLGDNLTIKAVFCYSEDSAYVTFRDMGNTILMAISADSDGYVNVPTNLIAYAGYTFIGWYDADGNKYEEENGRIKVNGNAAITIYAKYKADTETVYTVTVDGIEKGKYTYGSYVTVTAEDIEGKEFAGWYINGTLVSYDKAYSFYVTGNVALEARYSDTVVVKEPVITLLVSERKETGNGSQYIIFTAAWSADSSYTFVEAGIILAKDNSKELTLENVDNSTILKKATRLTTVEGTYAHTFTLSSDTAKANAVYARAYFTFIKDGKVVTIYTTVQISKPI